MTATVNDAGEVALGNNEHQRVTLQFPQADTYAKGTIMARKINADTPTIAYTRADDSTSTVVGSPYANMTLEAGAYTITAGTMTAGVGTWTAVAPSGKHEQFTSTASDDNLEFPNLGLYLTTTEAGTPSKWDTGDIITATVVADGDTVIYDPDGSNGAQVPTGVMPAAKTVTAQSDVPFDIIISGLVNQNRLVIDDGTTITETHLALLKDIGIIPIDQDELSTVDNYT